ncbi:MAG: ribbon-helix-helix domain-containing protein [Alphaproteobacteria bacterium]
MNKRSIRINGHATSVSLEDAFWDELRSMAEERGQTVPALIAELDKRRTGNNLSSALRLAVLDHLRTKAGLSQ